MRARVIKILDVAPVIYQEEIRASIEDRKALARKMAEETNGLVKLDVVTLDYGTTSIEGAYDEHINAAYILQKVKWAESMGYNAVVIDCFGDPALDAAREIVDIPVVGANHAATFLAAQIAHKFSIISTLPEMVPSMIALLRKYGLLQHLTSIETIHIPVLELEKEPAKTVERVVAATEDAYRKGAYAVVLGCTGMSFIAEEAQRRLLERGLRMPVIEPLRAAIYTAVAWVLMGISHSKVAYSTPRTKLRRAEFSIPM
jgi:allantoin racemase